MILKLLLWLGLLASLVVVPLVDAEQPGDLRRPQNDRQDEAKPILVHQYTRDDGRVFDCYRTVDRKILVQSITKENELIKYFELDEGVFYRCSELSRLKLIDFFLINGEAAALFEVDGAYFLFRSTKGIPKVNDGEIWVAPLVKDCWNFRYHVRMTDPFILEQNFDFDTEGEQPKIMGAKLSELDTVMVTFQKSGGKSVEIANYSICLRSDVPTFDAAGVVGLYKNGSVTKSKVFGWNSVMNEDVFAEFYLDKKALRRQRMTIFGCF